MLEDSRYLPFEAAISDAWQGHYDVDDFRKKLRAYQVVCINPVQKVPHSQQPHAVFVLCVFSSVSVLFVFPVLLRSVSCAVLCSWVLLCLALVCGCCSALCYVCSALSFVIDWSAHVSFFACCATPAFFVAMQRRRSRRHQNSPRQIARHDFRGQPQRGLRQDGKSF